MCAWCVSVDHRRGRKCGGCYGGGRCGIAMVLGRRRREYGEVILPRDALFVGVRVGIVAGGHGI